MENFLILFLKAIIYEQILRTVPWNRAFRVCLPENDRKTILLFGIYDTKEFVEFIFLPHELFGIAWERVPNSLSSVKNIIKVFFFSTSILTFIFDLMNSGQHFVFCFFPLYSVGRQCSLKSPKKRNFLGEDKNTLSKSVNQIPCLTQTCLLAQLVQNPPTKQETWFRSLGQDPWRWERQPTPVFTPGESHRQRSLVGYGPKGYKVLDRTEWLSTQHTFHTELSHNT